MPEPIDDLLRRWRAQPDAPLTIAVCEALRREGPERRRPYVDEVCGAGLATHAASPTVLLAVAWLYADEGRLEDAQGALVSAGRVSPSDPQVFRLFGQVLLRRGEADRATTTLKRAVSLGANDAETVAWLERATAFKPLQASDGALAVAARVREASRAPAVSAEAAGEAGATPARRDATIELEASDLTPSTAAPQATQLMPTRPAADGAVPTPAPARSPFAGGTAVMSAATGHEAPAAAPSPAMPPAPVLGMPAVAGPGVPGPGAPAPSPGLVGPSGAPAVHAYMTGVQPGPAPQPWVPSASVAATAPLDPAQAPGAAAAPSPPAPAAPVVIPAAPPRAARRSRVGLVIGILLGIVVVLGAAAVAVTQFYPELLQKEAPQQRAPRRGKH